MQGFFDKVSKSASAVANKAGNKANELLEVGKLKAQIVSQKQEISTAKKEIGDYYYSLYEDGKTGDNEDEKLKDLCEKIAAINKVITDLEKQVEAAKDEHDAKSSMNSAQE